MRESAIILEPHHWDSLLQLATKLQALCHQPNCGFKENCPQFHPKCNKKLNIYTAIAWEAEKILRTFRCASFYDTQKKAALQLYALKCILAYHDSDMERDVYKYIVQAIDIINYYMSVD